MTSIADVPDSASRQLFGTLRRNHWAMSLKSESFGWSHWSSFERCCQIIGSLIRPFKNKRCHLASLLQSRSCCWQSCGVSRQAPELPDVDPLLASLAVPQQFVLSEADRQVCESPKKKLKMSMVIDQPDATEVTTLRRLQIDINFQNHTDTAGAEPLQEVAPTPEQIAAMEEKMSTGTRHRMRTSLFSPPLGRIMHWSRKLRNWTQQPDGTFKAIDVSGPPEFDAWFAF